MQNGVGWRRNSRRQQRSVLKGEGGTREQKRARARNKPGKTKRGLRGREC